MEVLIESLILYRLQGLSGDLAEPFGISCLNALYDLCMERNSFFRSLLRYGKRKSRIQDVLGNIADLNDKWVPRDLIHLHVKLDIVLFVLIDVPSFTVLTHFSSQPLQNLNIGICSSLDHGIYNATSMILRYSSTDFTSSLSIMSIGVMDFR